MSQASKFYLVTGGSGFLGASLVRKLVSEGHRVRVFDNNSRGSASKLRGIESQIEFFEGDIRDAEAVRKACRNIDTVCHLAFVNGTEFFYSKPELVLEVGVKGMVNILDACIAENVRDFVLASSSEVYQTAKEIPTDEAASLSIPDPLNPRYSYAGGKIISELMAINYGRKFFDRVVIFRPHNVYGPDMGFEHVIPQFCMRFKDLMKTKPTSKKIDFPIQGNGKETRAFIFIDDFTNALYRVIQSGKHLEIYHIGTEDEFSISDLVHEIAKLCNRDIEILPGPLTQGSTLRRCPKTTKLKNLGFTPSTSLRDGLSKTLAWYLESN